MSSSLRIVVSGLIGQHPLGGVAWDYVQYAAGLARLGHDVYYLEDSGEWPYDPRGATAAAARVHDCSVNVAHLDGVMERFGLADRWAFRCSLDGSWAGLSESRVREVAATADLLLNVSGSLVKPERYRGRGVMAYVDSDPVFTQANAEQRGRFRDRLDAHDVLFTFGETLPDDLSAGYAWLPTRQPILLDEWRTATAPGRAFTTVMTWSSYAAKTWRGRRLAQKDVEFRRFVALPSRVPDIPLEVAVRATRRRKKTTAPIERLVEHGWRVVDPLHAVPDVATYRDYILRSRGEWSVAKGGYVSTGCGWFSCRSACYLAAGRPVVVQDTGFSSVLPVGEGLLAFETPEDAARALEEVEARYDAHARAARDVAESHFAADAVLGRLLDDVFAAAPVQQELRA